MDDDAPPPDCRFVEVVHGLSSRWRKVRIPISSISRDPIADIDIVEIPKPSENPLKES